MKKQCKRKIYKLVNPITYAMEGVAPPQGEKLRQLQMLEMKAVQAFRTGHATVNDWSKVTGLMNLAENLAKNGVGIEVLACCDEANQHLIEAAQRYEKTGRMGMTGQGLKCLDDLYEWHDLQRASVSLSEYERHILDTANRIRSKAPEVTDVLEAA